MHNIQPFNMESGDLFGDWKKWLGTFEYTLTSASVTSQKLKFSNLMSLAGHDIQDIYENTDKDVKEKSLEELIALYELRNNGDGDDEPTEEPVYDNCILRLNKYFGDFFDAHAAKREFRNTKQLHDESFSAFIIRLKKAAKKCGFANNAECAKEIIFQVSEAAKHKEVKDKAFEWQHDTLSKIEGFGRMFESRVAKNQSQGALRPLTNQTTSDGNDGTVEMAPIVRGGFSGRSRRPNSQQPSNSYGGYQRNHSNRHEPYAAQRGGGFNWRGHQGRGRGFGSAGRGFSSGGRGFTSSSGMNRQRLECIRCGSWDHVGNSSKCSAKEKQCDNCEKFGHVAVKCDDFHAYISKKQAEQLNQLDDFYDDEV